LGGKWEEVEKNLFFPSIGHQALDLLSPSFSFFLKGGLESLEVFFFPGQNF
jgi:hypothetical protein